MMTKMTKTKKMTKMKIFASSDVGGARQSSKDKAQFPPTQFYNIIQYNTSQNTGQNI